MSTIPHFIRFFLLVVILCTYSCKPVKTEVLFDGACTGSPAVFKTGHPDDPGKLNCVIENNSTSPVRFYITPVEIDLYNTGAMVHGLISDSMSQEEKCIALWKFVCEWRYHDLEPATIGSQAHSPGIMMNSLESGFCDDANAVLANLGLAAGIPSHVCELGSHVAMEFFYSGDWHLFDADGDIYYRNLNGEIAGLNDLVTQPALFERGKTCRNHPYLIYKVRSDKRKSAILDSTDNRIAEWYSDAFPGYNSSVMLNENERIEFCVEPTSCLNRKFNIGLLDNGGPYFVRRGLLIRYPKQVEKNTREWVVTESSPYAIDQVSVNSSLSAGPVYFSTDSIHWYFKGIVSSAGSVTFDPRILKTKELVFNYYLKFVVDDKNAKNGLEVSSRFCFSDKLFFYNKLREFEIKTLDGDWRNLKLKLVSERAR